MKVLIYSAKDFEIPYIKAANTEGFEVIFTQDRLTSNTAMKALGFNAVSIFSADDASANVLEKLHDFGVKYITLRSTGYDNVHLETAKKFKIKVANTPGYSPHAIAEHAIGLLLASNRKLVHANTNVKQQNFSLSSLVGFDLYGKRVGVLGAGAIGAIIIKILHGFGCEILANDLNPDLSLTEKYDVNFVPKELIYTQCDVIIIALPHTSVTNQLIDKETIAMMKPGCLLVNIARGGIVNTQDIIDGLDEGVLSGYATDVYAKEGGVFFYDHSDKPFKDALLETLVHHPKVLLTPHQAFATREALTNMAAMTFHNLSQWSVGAVPDFELI